MKYAADFRQIARETLHGKWKAVILVSFVAVLLGAAGTDGLTLELELENDWTKAVIQFAGVTVGSFGGGRSSLLGRFLLDYAKTIALVSAVISIFSLVPTRNGRFGERSVCKPVSANCKVGVANLSIVNFSIRVVGDIRLAAVFIVITSYCE